jgi:thiol-disulfide isomerase/thioredoxin
MQTPSLIRAALLGTLIVTLTGCGDSKPAAPASAPPPTVSVNAGPGAPTTSTTSTASTTGTTSTTGTASTTSTTSTGSTTGTTGTSEAAVVLTDGDSSASSAATSSAVKLEAVLITKTVCPYCDEIKAGGWRAQREKNGGKVTFREVNIDYDKAAAEAVGWNSSVNVPAFYFLKAGKASTDLHFIGADSTKLDSSVTKLMELGGVK